jgi:hypothetical protein
MYIQHADLFRGMSKDFLKKVMEITTKESHEKGAVLFGEMGHVVFVVSRPGEAFGWSSLIGRNLYSASAECKVPTRLLKMEKEKFLEILEKDPANGFIFFKRLAATLGNRLLQSYRQISAGSQAEISPSFGTGQVLASAGTQ